MGGVPVKYVFFNSFYLKGNINNVVLAKFQVKSNSVYIESTLLKDVNVEFWHINPLIIVMY